MKNDCTCDICKSACLNRPGFSRPEEIEPQAQHLGLSLQEYFNKYLCVDYYFGNNKIKVFNGKGAVYILAPARKGENNKIAPYIPHGCCIFFDNGGLCDIHANQDGKIIKPMECRLAHHGIDFNERLKKEYDEGRLEIVRSWNNQLAYNMIIDLLGREPQFPTSNSFDLFELISRRLNK